MATGDVGWMRGSSPLKGALLGLLLQHPGHGYDLANRLNRRLGPAWRIETKSLYPMLQQLERAALVSSKRVAGSGPTGQRLVYSPTEQAQGALTEWMAAGAPAEPQRGELQAKLAVARDEDVPRLLAALDCYERNCLVLLHASSEEFPKARSWLALAMSLSRAAALTRLRGELEWIALARREIAAFAAIEAKTRTADGAPARRVASLPVRGGARKSPARLTAQASVSACARARR
jgi:DNA-binding PadR family transcriptional regulator